MRRLKFFIIATLLIGSECFGQSGEGIEPLLNGENFFEIQRNAEEFFSKTQLKSVAFINEDDDNDYLRYKRWEYENQCNINDDGSFFDVLNKSEQILSQQSKSELLAPELKYVHTGMSIMPSHYTGQGIGRLDDVVFHPTDPNVLYVSAKSGGGIWKSIDGGLNYEPIGDNLPMMKAPILKIDKDKPETLYILLGDLTGGAPAGIYKTLDEGKNWNPTSITGISGVEDFEMSPVNSNLLMVASSYGLYRSVDGLNTKTRVLGGNIVELIIGNDGQKVYALKLNGSNLEILRSEDAGVNWIVTHTMEKSSTSRYYIEIPNTEQDWVYIANGNTIYRSKDSGVTFEQMGDVPDGVGPYLHVSPIDANRLYSSFVYPKRSDNGGRTWGKLNLNYYDGSGPLWENKQHVDIMEIRNNPHNNRLYFCSHGGLNIYDERNNKFYNRSNNLGIRQIYRMSVSQKDIRLKTNGTQDNGTRCSIVDKPGQWQAIGGGDGMQNIIDPVDNTIIYTCAQDGGVTRNVVINGEKQNSVNIRKNIPNETSLKNAWVAPYYLSEKDHNTITIGYNKIVRSRDKGNTWQYLSNDLFAGKPVIDIAVGMNNDNIIYCVKGNSYAYTYDGGVNWHTNKSLPLSNLNAIRVATNPYDDKIVYVVSDKWGNGITSYKVSKSVNGAQTFSDFSEGLPDVQCKVLVVEMNEKQEERLYLGTNFGVYYRDESMSEWLKFGSDLPNSQVMDLAVHYKEQKLVVGTFGRGTWEIPLYSSLVNTGDVSPFLPDEKLNMLIAPNPVKSNSKLHLEFSNHFLLKPEQAKMNIYNVQGQLISSEVVQVVSGSGEVNIEQLKAGIYILEMSIDKVVFRKRFLVTE